MTLTALLSAQLPSLDGAGEGLAALLSVAGLTVIERQAEDAAAVGVGQLLVLVDAVPPELAAAVDRIRGRGLVVTVVRDGAAVVEANEAATSRLLLVADGMVAPRALWEAMVGASTPRLLAVSDTPATASLERIDAERRWAGLALIDGDAVAALAGMPTDWDPQLALLRAAIQGNAPSMLCEPQLFERGDIAMLDRAVAADLVEQRLLAQGTGAVIGLVHANLAMPVARASARWLLRGQHGGVAAAAIAAVGAAIAGTAMVLGYPAIAVGSASVGLLARAAGATIAAFRPEAGLSRLLARAGEALFAAAILATAWAAADSYRAHAILWLLTGVSLVLMVQLGRVLAHRRAASPTLLWDDGAIWITLGVGLAVGSWLLAFTAAVPLAVAATLVAVWRGFDGKAV